MGRTRSGAVGFNATLNASAGAGVGAVSACIALAKHYTARAARADPLRPSSSQLVPHATTSFGDLYGPLRALLSIRGRVGFSVTHVMHVSGVVSIVLTILMTGIRPLCFSRIDF